MQKKQLTELIGIYNRAIQIVPFSTNPDLYRKGWFKYLFNTRTHGIAMLEQFLEGEGVNALSPYEEITGKNLKTLLSIIDERNKRIAGTSRDYINQPNKSTNRIYQRLCDLLLFDLIATKTTEEAGIEAIYRRVLFEHYANLVKAEIEKKTLQEHSGENIILPTQQPPAFDSDETQSVLGFENQHIVVSFQNRNKQLSSVKLLQAQIALKKNSQKTADAVNGEEMVALKTNEPKVVADAFEALGVTRDKVLQTLKNCASKDADRKVLAAEIVDALIEGRLLGPVLRGFWLSEGSVLYNQYREQKKAFDEYTRKLERNGSSSLASNPSLLHTLCKQAWDRLQAFGARKIVYNAYINEIKNGMPLSHASILLFAKASNWSVYLWREGDESRGEADTVLDKNYCYEAENALSRVELLHTGKYGQFKCLEKSVFTQIDTHTTEEGIAFSVESPDEITSTKVLALYEAIKHIRVVPTQTVAEADEITTKALDDEKTRLQAILLGLAENQEAQKVVFETRLQRVERILSENLAIRERYQKAIAPYPHRILYYQRLRAEVAVNFSAVLLLASKLIHPWGGKLDDASASQSKIAGTLNISSLCAEILEPAFEGITYLAEHGETVVKLLCETLKISAKGAGQAASGIPIVGNAIGAGIQLIGSVAGLAEFCSELNQIGHGHEAFLDLTPKDVELLAEKIALIMTERVQEVLELLTDEGIHQLAFFDYRRLLLGLLQGGFQKSIPLGETIDTLCDHPLKQGRFLFRIPLTGNVALQKNKVVKCIHSLHHLLVDESQIPEIFEENWLHHGHELMIQKLCQQQRIAIPERRKKAENIIILERHETKQEKPDVIPTPLPPVSQIVEPQALSRVKETIVIYNALHELESKANELETMIKGQKVKLASEENERKVLDKMLTDYQKVTNQKLEKQQGEIKKLKEKNTKLKQKNISQRQEELHERNIHRYSKGLKAYKQGKEEYKLSQDETIVLQKRVNHWGSARSLFRHAESAIEKVNLAALQPQYPVDIAKLNKKVEKWTSLSNANFPEPNDSNESLPLKRS
ncbi:MAG: hypothetical protein WC785_03005 [Tatlockia sp.]|jgi:hypothetical protein